MSKKLNIVVGLKDNKQCRKLESSIRPIMENMLTEDCELENLEITYEKSFFDDCVAAGFVNVGIMLEKFDNIAIGQGTIKVWSNLNPDIHLILVMDDLKKSSAKAHGLYKREYYNGLFLSDFLSSEMMRVILHGRTKEEAYEYYGMDEYYKNRELEEKGKLISDIEVVSTDIEKDVSGKSDDTKISSSYVSLNSDKVTTTSENMIAVSESLNIQSMKKLPEIDSQSDLPRTSSIAEEKDFEQKPIVLGEISNNSREDTPSNNNTAIEQIDIMTLQDEEELSESKNVSIINDNDWTKFSTTVKKSVVTKDIIKTKNKKGISVKQVIEAINSYATDDVFFQNIVDEAELIIHDNEQELTQQMSSNEDVSKMFNDVIDYYSYKNEVELNKALSLIDNQQSMDYFLATVQDYIDMINEQTYHVEKGDVLGEVFYLFLRFILEYDILTDFIEDDSVTSIHVVDWNKIRIKKGTRRYSVKNTFISESYYMRFVANLKIRNMKSMMSDHLSTYFTDKKVSDKFICNVFITNEFVSNTGRPEILIKKNRKERFTIKELLGNKLTLAAAALLITAIKNGESILFVGPASCGATSLMNTLLEYIPREKSGVVLQHKDEIAAVEHPELIIQHPATVRIKSENVNNTEVSAVTSYSILDIAASALNLDVDYYVMVDVVGSEAASFYKAFDKGFVTWGNIQAKSVTGGLQRLADIILASEPDLSRDSVCNVIANKFSIVVYMEKLRVVSISKVSSDGYDSEKHEFHVEEVINNKRK